MYSEIYQLRNLGQIHISRINVSNISFDQALTELGLSPSTSSLVAINFDDALNIITSILHKDLAYNFEIMPENKAHYFANKILSDLYTDGCELFTNAIWSNQKDSSSTNAITELSLISWNPMTLATFDTGVIIKHDEYCCCVWVEDED